MSKKQNDLSLLPSSQLWEGAQERRAAEAMRVTYGGGVVDIQKGARYFVDSFEHVLVGWHGSYDPPCGIDGESMFEDCDAAQVFRSPTSCGLF